MEIVSILLKYGFLVALSVEAIVIGRALVRLAQDKAQPEAVAPLAQE